MSNSSSITALPDNFDGQVRLFPLPNLVLFPGVVQPLHIFEPRYCDMLEDALATDQLLTMGLLKPGWEAEYEARPVLESIVCIGKIITHTRLPEGKHNVLLLGLRRARIIYELPVTAAFRRARVELLDDEFDPLSVAKRGENKARLMALFRQLMPKNKQVHEQLTQLLEHNVDLALLTDIVAFTASFHTMLKQQLLSETNVDRRALLLLRTLEAAIKHPETVLSPSPINFPPPFSAN